MRVIYFAGVSPSNESWMNQFANSVKKQSKTSDTRHKYSFWSMKDVRRQDGRKIIEKELSDINILYSDKGHDLIVGKSLGCYFALKLAKKLKPKLVVLIGIPVASLAEEGIDIIKEIQQTSSKIYIINNDHDPQLNKYNLKELTQKNSNTISLYLLNGNTHKYLDFDLYSKLVIAETD